MTLSAKNIVLIILVILLAIVLVVWIFGGNHYTSKVSIEKFTDTSTNSSTGLSLDEEILLVNSILTTIHYNFMAIADCSNTMQNGASAQSNIKCVKDSDKETIYNAYKTSQTQPIENRLNIFETLVENYKSEYGDMSNIYWDFKLLDIKNDVVLDEYYYAIVKNIAVNKIYEYVRSNMEIIPVEIKKKYPLEIPRNIIQDIIDKYFKLDVNDSSIRFIGIQNAVDQNVINQATASKPATNTISAGTVDMILSEPDKYIYTKPTINQSESEEILILKSRGPLIQAE